MTTSVDGRIGYVPVEIGLGVDDVAGAGVYAGDAVAAGAPLCIAFGSADGEAFTSTAAGDGEAGAAAGTAAGAWSHDRSRTLTVVVALMCAISAWASANSV
jgi:hypothetical protein